MNEYHRQPEYNWSDRDGVAWRAYGICALFVAVSFYCALFVGSCLFWFALGRAILRAFN